MVDRLKSNEHAEMWGTRKPLEFVRFRVHSIYIANFFVDLGPPQLSAKFKNRRDDRDRRDRDDRRGDYRRPDPRDQPRDYRDSREYYDSRDYRPITYRAPVASYDRVPAYRDDRYIDNRGEDMYRRDPRHEVRAPPVAQPVYDTRRSPPRTAEYRSRSPVVAGDRK